ncbi:hypothetical protein [Dactylosporangium sp. NPDC050588]|uniref:hypothetical protein n=1 Tax=Dactylosporangium sp. NPDC050588 TaxID=3157211 RepID=UPI0033DE1FB5
MNNRAEVRDFLTTRRAKITPEQAGVPTAAQALALLASWAATEAVRHVAGKQA